MAKKRELSGDNRQSCCLILFEEQYVAPYAFTKEDRIENLKIMVNESSKIISFESVKQMCDFFQERELDLSYGYIYQKCNMTEKNIKQFVDDGFEIPFCADKLSKNSKAFNIDGYEYGMMAFKSKNEYGVFNSINVLQSVRPQNRILEVVNDEDNYVLRGQTIDFENELQITAKNNPEVLSFDSAKVMQEQKRMLPDFIVEEELKKTPSSFFSKIRYIEFEYNGTVARWYSYYDFQQEFAKKNCQEGMENLKRHTSPHGAKYVVVRTDKGEGTQKDIEQLFIQESNIYLFMLNSSNRKFSEWVTMRVLPEINRTGMYDIRNDKMFFPNAEVSVPTVVETTVPVSVESKKQSLESNIEMDICIPLVKKYMSDEELSRKEMSVLAIYKPELLKEIEQNRCYEKARFLMQRKDLVNITKKWITYSVPKEKRTKARISRSLKSFYNYILIWTGLNKINNGKDALELIDSSDEFNVVDAVNIFTTEDVSARLNEFIFCRAFSDLSDLDELE